MMAGGDHPILLPWYVSGRLDDEAAADVARHLAQCDVCRREAEALTSMQATLRRHGRTDHVPIVDLVDYEEREAAAAGTGAASITAHLRGCATCSDELALLRAARRDLDLPEAAAPGGRAREDARAGGLRRWGFLAAAAAVVVLVAPFFVRWPARREPPAMTGLDLVSFSPTSRGGMARPELRGDGPWAVSVLLPLMAPTGTYLASIQRADGSTVPGLVLRTSSRDEGRLTFLLPALPEPGAYRLRLLSEGQAGAEPIDYAFDRPAEHAAAPDGSTEP